MGGVIYKNMHTEPFTSFNIGQLLTGFSNIHSHFLPEFSDVSCVGGLVRLPA